MTLGWSRNDLEDGDWLSIVQQCLHLQELLIVEGKRLTDGGMVAVLEICGSRLTKLFLVHCDKVKLRTLQAITLHCVSLRFLKIVATGLGAPDIVHEVIVPDKLKDLLRLTLTATMVNKLMKSCADMFPRWRRILCKDM